MTVTRVWCWVDSRSRGSERGGGGPAEGVCADGRTVRDEVLNSQERGGRGQGPKPQPTPLLLLRVWGRTESQNEALLRPARIMQFVQLMQRPGWQGVCGGAGRLLFVSEAVYVCMERECCVGVFLCQAVEACTM